MRQPKPAQARTSKRISLAPLTPAQALAAALRVKPADIEREEKAAKREKPTKK